MSKTYDRTLEFLTHADAIIEHGYEDTKAQLEEEYNTLVDECVYYGDYSPEEGEAKKHHHHDTLWASQAGHLALAASEVSGGADGSDAQV